MEPVTPLPPSGGPALPNALAWLEALLAHSGAGCLLVDGAGIVLRANAALGQMFGVSLAPLQGRPAAAALELLEQGAVVLDDPPDGSAPPPEGVFVRYLRLEEPRPCLVRQQSQVVTDPAGSAGGQLWLFEDLTPQDERARLWTDMIGFMTYDLRSPLLAITNGLTMVCKGFAGAVNDQQRELLDISNTAVKRMLGVINQLLDISKMEAGQLSLNREPCSICDIAEQAREQVIAAARSVNVELILEVPDDLPSIAADREKLIRVVQNLLANAINHSPQSGSVTIAARIAEDGPGAQNVVVWVDDQGPEVPEQYRRRVFEKFALIPGRYAGSGLDLAFARLTVEAHGGAIWIENGESGGSRFCFSLPLAETH